MKLYGVILFLLFFPAMTHATSEAPIDLIRSIDIDYSMYQSKSSWNIYDMKVEGISLVLNYRTSFNREIRTNGMDGLIRHLAVLNQ